MIAKIIKLFGLMCLLNGVDIRQFIAQLFPIAGTVDEVKAQFQYCTESIRLLELMKNNHKSFLKAIYDLEVVRLSSASEAQKDLIKLLSGKLHTIAKIVELMDEQTFNTYLLLQKIDVQHPGAAEDFAKEFTLERMIEFLLNINQSWIKTLQELQQNFNTEMANNGAFAEAFNKIRDGIRNSHPHLLPKLNSLFGLPEE